MQQYLDQFLGRPVKDIVSGFSGVATGANLMLNGNVQIAVAPISENSAVMNESWSIDVHNLEVVGEQVVPNRAKETFKVQLQDKVVDTITGFKGKVVSINYFVNGCVNAHVENKKEGRWLFIERLTVVSPSVEKSPPLSTGCAPQLSVRMY